VLDRLLGRSPSVAPEGAQLKLNMLLTRLPRLRSGVDPATAFAGTFHVHESATELERAYQQAAAGEIPDVPPVETYCHSLTDDSILGADLRATGHHTLTAFGLHMPARLFAADPDGARERALTATLRSIDSVLAEPLEDCLARDATGAPCLEARSPVDLEADVGLPGGHIFHRDLAWPWAEHDDEVGAWGVETADPRILIAGAGARRGGGVSGIPGRAAALAVLGTA
jgi:phytoene dehydrogenase-like protein